MLILSSFGDVSDPFGWFVATLLGDAQEPHPQTTGSEHWHLKLNTDWRFDPRNVAVGHGQIDFTSK